MSVQFTFFHKGQLIANEANHADAVQFNNQELMDFI